MEKKLKIFAVAGPTASGKTALAVSLAKALNGEVISADSMQIYSGMEIGTAMPSAEEMQGVPHHLLGFLEPKQSFSVADYVEAAGKATEEIAARGHRVFLAGGTGLYIRSFLSGLRFDDDSRDDDVRAALQAELESDGIEPLYARLTAVDSAAAARIHPNNQKRVVRALEYCTVTGRLFSAQVPEAQAPYESFLLCLSYRDREALYARIERRVDLMIENGLIDEARAYYERYGAQGGTSAQAIGYKELFAYFAGESTLEEAVACIKRETRHYAKRQLTWFRREQNAKWLYVDDYPDFDTLQNEALSMARVFFNLDEGRPTHE